MYNNLINSNNVFYISNKVISKLPVYSKIEGIEKNYIKLDSSFETFIEVSKKELESVKHKRNPLLVICGNLSLPYANQLISLNKYEERLSCNFYNNHIKFNLWKILTYSSLSQTSIYGLLLNATKSNYIIGISGYTFSILNNNRVTYDYNYKKITY